MRQRVEHKNQQELRQLMHSEGWHTEKTHGNAYQSGWPDLLCMHPHHGRKWIEMKIVGGKLSESQVATFLKWHKYGERIYVCNDTTDYRLIFGPPNWTQYIPSGFSPRLPKGFGRRTSIRNL